MKCVHCENDLGIDWTYGWFSSGKKILLCAACNEPYRRNVLPALIGVFALAATNLLVAIVSQGRLKGFVLGIVVMLAVMSYLLQQQPLVPLRRSPVSQSPRWYRSPVHYLLVALLMVWYFMFLH